MKLLIEIFLFSIPLVFLTWILPKRYVLLSQILLTSLFILYKSPLSFCVISITAFGNYYLLHKSKLNTSVKINISLVFLILMIIIAKVYVTIDHNWVIPLGLSYYTFRNIHYTLEVYKGKIQQENLLHYLAYNFFLPSFTVGPINRYPDFIKDWNRRRFNKDQFSLGLERILYGSSKIIILGNYFFTLKANQFIENIDSKYVWLKTFWKLPALFSTVFFNLRGILI